MTADPTRALIVEDDPVVARSIARRLLREGYTVSLAGTCRAGRGAGGGFHNAQHDLVLPDGRGTDLADELLRLGAVRGVVFYTGSLDVAQRERAQLFGPVIDKGRDLEQLVELLEPFPTAPPHSQMAPAMKTRQRTTTGSRFVGEEDAVADSVATSSTRR
jgi:DNA-binding NtrC family response regulator